MLMLLSPSLFRGAEGIDTRTMDRIGHIPLIGTFTMWASYQMMESFFEPYMTAEKHDRVKPMVKEARKTPPDVATSLVISFFDYIDQYGDLTERLTSSNTPVWYVRGDQDNIILSDEDRSRLNKSNNVIVKDIPGGKHFIMIDRPSEISDLIFDILLRQSSIQLRYTLPRRQERQSIGPFQKIKGNIIEYNNVLPGLDSIEHLEGKFYPEFLSWIDINGK